MKMLNTFDYRKQTLSDTEIDNILKSINMSLPQFNDIAGKEKLITTNGKFLSRWNYIFTNIKSLFDSKYYELPVFNRGPLWEFMGIYNKITKILYILAKEENIKRIIKDNNNTHYIKILSYKNHNLNYDYQKQLSLLGPNDEIIESLLQEFKKMFMSIDEVKCCKAILFKEGHIGITKISETILDYDLNTIGNYDLSDYIIADIDNIEDTHNYQDIHISDTKPKEEINLPLRKDKIAKKKELSDKLNDREDILTEASLSTENQDTKNRENID